MFNLPIKCGEFRIRTQKPTVIKLKAECQISAKASGRSNHTDTFSIFSYLPHRTTSEGDIYNS